MYYGPMSKVLIIRFSSFGDVAQSLAITPLLKADQIDFLTKSEFAQFVKTDPYISKVWSFEKESGLLGLWQIARKLKSENYDYIYDAHNTMRTAILGLFIIALGFKSEVFVRPKNRWKRFLLFKMGKDVDLEFQGAKTYFNPIINLTTKKFEIVSRDWKFSNAKLVDQTLREFNIDEFIVCAPSAAWEMKRWPIEHWREFVATNSHQKLVFVGGPNDSFIEEICEGQEHTINLTGKVSILDTCYLILKSQFVVSADTGVLHVADVMNKKTFAIIGPTAFGFPSSTNAEVLEVPLECRPCTKDGRGNCSQKVYQKCMVDIKPKMLSNRIQETFSSPKVND
jgi:heptosyltransferase-2